MVRRIFVQKKEGFDVEAKGVLNDLKENLLIKNLENVAILNRYDVEGISDDSFNMAKSTIFSEPQVDNYFIEEYNPEKNSKVFAVEFLPGQFDQRAASLSECLQILTGEGRPNVKTAKLYVLSGNISDEEVAKIKKYLINPVEAREASLEKPEKLDSKSNIPTTVENVENFINMTDEELEKIYNQYGLAMDLADLKFCQNYFKSTEKRDPTITEMKMIDTYWSDHCRHTTFMTRLEVIDIEWDLLKSIYEDYLSSRKYVYEDRKKDICLMDIATIAAKELKKRGLLDKLDESEEINACSIKADIMVDGKLEEYLIMFKNETHNHPTEIEPFGGAATCLGGAIRDPLSGRVYVYQAMRITGAGDPTKKVSETLANKLPQRKIVTTAAAGYSSYGNQIGLTTGQVAEIYHPGFVAKRMELGAVIGAAPAKNVVRKRPEPGDVVILLGGKTGRDGCGGATGSSKAHDSSSLESCGAEVQKGNAPEERKIQRLFRNEKATRMIKRCNDFGAGGVSVAIGELADGLLIDLNKVPKKYEGLDGTELAISESQERMAVVVEKDNVDKFIEYAKQENLEATVVASVTKEPRVKMIWNGNTIVDVSREFLDTNGDTKKTNVKVVEPDYTENVFNKSENINIKQKWEKMISSLNCCSQKGLVERFDSTIGANTVLMPFGGKYQDTPAEAMVARIPTMQGFTNTGTIMSYGYNPYIGVWSPFHGSVYAIVESVSKYVAVGGDYKKAWLTLQEFFEKLRDDSSRWGKPFAALLGAYYVQKELGIVAIGGKDSMSGSFNELDVPPTLVSFCVGTVDINKVVSNEFKKAGSKVFILKTSKDENLLPEFEDLKENYEIIQKLINDEKVYSVQTITNGGIANAITKMCIGNKLGFKFEKDVDLFEELYGSFIVELKEDVNVGKLELLGSVLEEKQIIVNKDITLSLEEIITLRNSTLEKVYPTKTKLPKVEAKNILSDKKNILVAKQNFAKPRVFIPVFPGTNCEYDLKKAFEDVGAETCIKVFKNLSSNDVEESIKVMAQEIDKSQIIMLPGGFSAGDEPDGSGKFIATVFRNPILKEAMNKHLKEQDGLVLGICNGFQALIKLGLVPFGEIVEPDDTMPTLTYNTIGRHMSKYVTTKVVSKLSPWFNKVNLGDEFVIPISHGEGRFIASEDMMKKLIENGQIATQYVDMNSNATFDIEYNPNNSNYAVEAITSPDGRVLGKMGHSERCYQDIVKNIPGNKDQKLFESGVEYYKI